MICSITSSGFDIPPDQKASQTLSTLPLSSPVIILRAPAGTAYWAPWVGESARIHGAEGEPWQECNLMDRHLGKLTHPVKTSQVLEPVRPPAYDRGQATHIGGRNMTETSGQTPLSVSPQPSPQEWKAMTQQLISLAARASQATESPASTPSSRPAPADR